MPAPGSAHGLGPHVVGQRVVVRRRVPGETGPSGGPAMTDVVGTCLSWDGTTCVVAPESGAAVTIPLHLVVTGKPVPPRASLRQRVSAREAEIRSLPLWTHPTTVPLGEWVLRTVEGAHGRRSRRANSCLALGEPGVPLDDALAIVTDFYTGREREVRVQAEAGSDPERALVDRGWVAEEPLDAPYLVGSLVMARRAAGGDEGTESVVDDTRILTTLAVDGAEVGRVRGELNGDWLWVHGLSVEESRRRRGLGSRLTAGLLAAAAEQGASTAWLEVDRNNTAAWMLYAGLGLREHHHCRFLSPRT